MNKQRSQGTFASAARFDRAVSRGPHSRDKNTTVTPHSSVQAHRRFGGMFSSHLQVKSVGHANEKHSANYAGYYLWLTISSDDVPKLR
jgi:hypothetical protein